MSGKLIKTLNLRFASGTLGSGPHAVHGDTSMTAPQSSYTEAIRVDIRQDATHPKEVPMRRMGTRVMRRMGTRVNPISVINLTSQPAWNME